MNDIRIDYSERDIERRFKVLEGAKWDLREAKRMWCWINIGFTPDEIPKLVTPEVSDGSA